jgi:multidrug resistance efflux pump
MTKKIYLFFLLFGFLLVGCSTQAVDATEIDNDSSVSESNINEINLDLEDKVVGATGNVDTLDHEILSWEVYGEIETLNVAVGDFVSEGDVLATLNEDSLYGNETEDSDETTDEVTYQDLVEAYTNVLEEQERFYGEYSDAVIAKKELQVAEQKQVLFEAEYDYKRDSNLPTQEQVDQATARLTIAEKEMADAQKKYDEFILSRTKPQYSGDEGYRKWLNQKWREDITLASAIQAYNDDYYAYLDVVDGVSETELAVLVADVEYQTQILAELEADLADLYAGPSEDDVAAMDQKVQEAQDALDVFEIVAPYDGRITELYGEEADVVSRGTALLRIDAWDQLIVEADLLEVDLDLVEVGDLVDIYFDSKGNVVYEGVVIDVSVVGESSWNITKFPVTVLITSEVEDIYPGMTAVIDIYVE